MAADDGSVCTTRSAGGAGLTVAGCADEDWSCGVGNGQARAARPGVDVVDTGLDWPAGITRLVIGVLLVADA